MGREEEEEGGGSLFFWGGGRSPPPFSSHLAGQICPGENKSKNHKLSSLLPSHQFSSLSSVRRYFFIFVRGKERKKGEENGRSYGRGVMGEEGKDEDRGRGGEAEGDRDVTHREG